MRAAHPARRLTLAAFGQTYLDLATDPAGQILTFSSGLAARRLIAGSRVTRFVLEEPESP